MNRLVRFVLLVAAIGPVGGQGAPARAGQLLPPFGVEFSRCVESIGVGLAPTANVVALTPTDFIPVGVGEPVSPIVVRTADCDGISVDGSNPKPGSVVQIGAVIVPPQPGVGDINNYTFWYYTTDAKLAHRLRDIGVPAQHVPTIRYDLDPQRAGIPNELDVVVRKPGAPRFAVAGTVIPSEVPTGSFEAIWWQGSAAGNVRMDTSVPVIAISSADLTLATDADNALGALIGRDTLGFPVLQQFNLFSRAHMIVDIPH
jgi:hypothetical protein